MKRATKDLKKQLLQLLLFTIACTLVISAALVIPLEESSQKSGVNTKTAGNKMQMYKKQNTNGVSFF
jgi:hypothetical protein